MPKALPLDAEYRAQCLEMVGCCDWLLPATFGDPEAEYHAARQTVALFDASFLTKVEAAGPDLYDYLNRRTSQRVIDMKPGDALRANQLNGEGRMEADFLVARLDEQRTLLLAPPAVEGPYLAALMDKYVFSEKVTFRDITAEWAAFALIGPRASDVLASLGCNIPASGVAGVSLPRGTGILVRVPYLVNSWTLVVPAAEASAIRERLRMEVLRLSGQPLGFLAFDTLRVEEGMGWWGIDLNARSIPLDADLKDAIHTNKGCYPGQETIAKILNLGHPARKLVGVVWDAEDPLPTNSDLRVDEAVTGKLTSSSFSPRLGRAIGLAMVRWNHREAGTVLTAPGGITGKVVALPMV